MIKAFFVFIGVGMAARLLETGWSKGKRKEGWE